MDTTRLRGARSRAASGIVALALAVAGLTATGGTAAADISPTPPTPQQRTAEMVSADALPTVQIDSGVVWSQAVVGNTVFAGGQFSQTRPAGAQAGQQLTPRTNLLAYDVTTGNLLPFAPQVNGVVKAVAASPDGSRIYIGGSFTKVDGKDRWGVAAFDAKSGALLDSFRPAVGGSFVGAIAVSDSAVYVGGLFTQANGVKRTNLAAFDLAGNLTTWAPTTNSQVDAMIMAPSGNRVIVGGRFTALNGATVSCSGAVDAVTGASLPWKLNSIITGGGGTGSGVMGLSTDGTYVYGTGWLQMSWYYEGVWAVDPETGDLVWAADGNGDHYDVFASGTGVYAVGHSHNGAPFGGWPNYTTPSGQYQFSDAFTVEPRGTLASGGYGYLAGKPAPAVVQWYPNWISGKFTGMGQAGWTIEGNSDYVVVGGEFLGVNGKLQQGLARFTKSSVVPSAQGPFLSATPRASGEVWEAPTFAAVTGGAQVSIRPNYDRDDRTLTYQLFRSGTSAPVATTTFDSDPWLRTTQTVTLSDTSALPNTTYTYTVKAVDSDGNTAASKTVTGKTGTYALPLKASVGADMSGLTGHFDASGTTGPAGSTVTGWQWDFGDGTTDTAGPAVDHAYAEAGTYTVTLTVTNDRGESATTTTQVTADTTVARDDFARSTATWATADVGGAWSTDKGPKVSDGTGQITLAKAQTIGAWLKNARTRDTDLTMGFSLDKASAGGGTFVSAVARRTDAGEYRSKLVVNADGTVSVFLTRVVGGTETILKQGIVPQFTIGAGDGVRVRFQAVTGAGGSTTLRAKVWGEGQDEPSAWFLTTTDSEAALQGSGYVGILGYLSSASTIAPQTVRVSDFTVTVP